MSFFLSFFDLLCSLLAAVIIAAQIYAVLNGPASILWWGLSLYDIAIDCYDDSNGRHDLCRKMAMTVFQEQ